MSFPWLESSVPKAFARTFADKSKAAWQREVRDRAATLMRLGHDKKRVEARCKRRLSWEFELDGKPKTLREVAGLVSNVYQRG
jgi:hypothetical protein